MAASRAEERSHDQETGSESRDAAGPYTIVRHPIYTGILAAMLATALVRGTAAALVGVVLLLLGFYLKARLEESFLRSELGEQAYSAYARRVPMLIPFAPS